MPAPRSQWKGFLKLSLVSCPVALYPAITDANKIKFRQVNKRTGNRVRQRLVDEVTGEAVDAFDKGRGYEIGAQQYIPVEEHEIETARAAAFAPAPGAASDIEEQASSRRLPKVEGLPPSRRPPIPAEADPADEPDDVDEGLPPLPPRLENDYTIEIERVVPRVQIDPAYYDKAYFIVPREPVGQEAFAVVRDAMGEKGMVALGHVILSNRRRPIAVEAFGKGLRGFVLRHLHEVRREADYFSDIPELELPPEMLDLAKRILETKTADLEPAFLEDRYQKALVEMLRKKQVERSTRPAAPATPSQENVVNLMDVLKRSLVAEGRALDKPPPRRPAARSVSPKRPTPRKRKAG
jgi:Ku protein